ncbi:Protein XRI1 [Forsythia ovata]|uniref:Protein XRI1 n=1 Tax=Forsythia ovata TaxID=205694 RepID=A0ABD1PJI0_9LAMI
MNHENANNTWDWQSQDYILEDNTSIDMSKCLLNGANQNEDFSYIFEDETTPVKACGDLVYHSTNYVTAGKELEQYREPLSQVKRRRTLQFESEVLDAPLCNDEAFLRSQETQDSLEEAMSEMSQWVAGFTEGTSASSNECLDPTSEGWISDCFNDAEMHFNADDLSSASGASDVQIDITELCNTPPEYQSNTVQKQPVRTRGNVVLRGRKSYIRSPPKLASSVVYPFAFIKPCGMHGDLTLKDINQRIHTPPSMPKNEDPSLSYPTSAITGKPVVGKTKIRTEGGKGSITIMRTKG